jgi:hypothetical protein
LELTPLHLAHASYPWLLLILSADITTSDPSSLSAVVGSISTGWPFAGDRGFESSSLQRRVRLSSEPRGCRRKAPRFGGSLRVTGDVRRDVQAANRRTLAVFSGCTVHWITDWGAISHKQRPSPAIG